MNIKKLKEILDKNNEPSFRLKQILKAVYHDGILDFNEITNLPKILRENLKNDFKVLSFVPEKILEAKDKKTVKAALRLTGGHLIETVLISTRPGEWSVCVSSQAGCALGCRFCATGGAGFKRNLTAEEITDQLLFWENYLNLTHLGLRSPLPRGELIKTHPNPPFQKKGGNKLTNIVFMGMGEPLLNWENVREAIKNLTDKELFNFGDRSISLSTVGIPEGIRKIAKEFPQVNLAISLHSANDKLRTELSPINTRFNLKALKTAIENYIDKTNRQVFVEYVMLDNINDREHDASELANYIKSFAKPYLMHVNLIAYNETCQELKASPTDRIKKFKAFLDKRSISATIRKSLGGEIKGACGQLVGNT
jgi:adenine C2-methylase RlmN of 23S rRNA A2503 and tRNA A37